MSKDFLLEIGCEELPPGVTQRFRKQMPKLIENELVSLGLKFSEIKSFDTPRRLAVLVKQLEEQQPPRKIERRGPSIESAYGKDGLPTIACLGFAKSCGVSTDQLTVRDTPKGKFVGCDLTEPGRNTREILPALVESALKKCDLGKSMRWGNSETQFPRPVHWVVMLFGSESISAKILGCETGQETTGHRFHYPKPFRITQAADYQQSLQTHGLVVVDFIQRKQLIKKLIERAAPAGTKILMDEELLDEVTSLVEWPVALCGKFNPDYLTVPKEVLITAMKAHQKCFSVINNDEKLQPYFVLVSNIESRNPQAVIQGNERVINARLSDAAFFYHNDLKISLKERLKSLEHITFQKELGTLADRSERISRLAKDIAQSLSIDPKQASEAGLLCKTDLTSEMVKEFPMLQGIMGYYYAKNDGYSEEIATAIKEHYQPRFSGDELPESLLGCCVALADKLDHLVGMTEINKLPTSDKDPFGLRRSALGIIRILSEKELSLSLTDLISDAAQTFSSLKLPNKNVKEEALTFITERMKAWCLDKGMDSHIYAAIAALPLISPSDFSKRAQAVQKFLHCQEAESLIAAHKRVNNILKKQTSKTPGKIEPKLFESPAEENLYHALERARQKIEASLSKVDYADVLNILSTLKEPIDHYFDQVMIMTEDIKQRNNRLALLDSLNKLLTQVADISLLQ